MHFYHCPRCGEKLVEKEIGDEGLLPYCNSCEIPYWDVFSSSIICAVINEENEIALLRQNYVSTTNYVCVAGMIKKGETCEETVCREVQEELGLTVTDMSFIRSYYYEKKELLMNGYLVKVKKKDFSLSGEVDNAAWFPIENAPSLLREGGIAWKLVTEILNQLSCTKSKKDINVRSTAKAIIYPSNKPTTKPNNLDGIPKIIVKRKIFSKTPVIATTILKITVKITDTNKKPTA